MSSPAQTASDWEKFFCSVADHLSDFAAKHWPLEDDGSGPDTYLASRKLLGAFPFPTDVLLLETGSSDPQVGPFATAIRYDLSHPNTSSVRLHGVIPFAEMSSHTQLIELVLGVEPELFDDIKRWPSMFGWNGIAVSHLVPYDARLDTSRYCDELADFLSDHTDLVDAFSTQVDFNAKYNLPSSSPKTDQELCRIDELTAFFVKISDGKPASLAERHHSVANIQLIPQVPDSVKRTFDLAKRLYIYGYFEYGFFTVSLHYAHLALDAALHARWSATLPRSVVLTCEDKKSRQTHQHSMAEPSHFKIRNFAKLSGWRITAVKVDGQPFPHTVKGVIADLVGQRLMTQYQRQRIEKGFVEIRNSLSHLEFAPVHQPTPDALRRIAYLINKLFDSLPCLPQIPPP